MSYSQRPRFTVPSPRLLSIIVAAIGALIAAYPAQAADSPLPGTPVAVPSTPAPVEAVVATAATVVQPVVAAAPAAAAVPAVPAVPAAPVSTPAPAVDHGRLTEAVITRSEGPAPARSEPQQTASAGPSRADTGSHEAVRSAAQPTRSADVRKSQRKAHSTPAHGAVAASQRIRAADAQPATTPPAQTNARQARSTGTHTGGDAPLLPLPAWPPAPSDGVGLASGVAGSASSTLLLFALAMSFFLLALPSLGWPLPIRLPPVHPASFFSRLERPG